MKVSQMQSMLARNAVVITKLGNELAGARIRMKESEGAGPFCVRLIRRNRPQIGIMSAIQRSLKDDIKAARTSKRVYKKHGVDRAQWAVALAPATEVA